MSVEKTAFKRSYLGTSTLFKKNVKHFTRNTLIAPHTGSGSTFVEGLGGVSSGVGEDSNTICRHSFIVSKAFFQAFSSWVNHFVETPCNGKCDQYLICEQYLKIFIGYFNSFIKSINRYEH